MFFTRKKEIKIAINSWIGYAPLFYAEETGELDKLGIKLITNVSLAEASDIFEVGKADLVTTTQHEYLSLKNSREDILPVILIDRSNGGDMVLSNKSLDKLKKSEEITAYLEIDSINSEVLKSFLKHHQLNDKKITYINKDQAQISNLHNENEAMLIVTYTPYNTILQANGFQELASTKNLDALVVIDAICAREKTYKTDKESLIALKKVLDKSIQKIQDEPQTVYKKVAKYLNNITYSEFLDSLNTIKWINKNPSPELLQKIAPLGYTEKTLLQ